MKRRPDSCDGLLCPECAPFGCTEQAEEVPDLEYTSIECHADARSYDDFGCDSVHIAQVRMNVADGQGLPERG